MKTKNTTLILLIFILLFGCRKSDFSIDGEYTLITDVGFGTGTRTLKNSEEYLIEGLVFVNDGQILTIEPGTVIRFKSGQADNASALIVARGGKIIAEGTTEQPIIFTAEADDLMGSVPISSQGLWGGIIILGNARVNTFSGEANIEGISLSEPRGIFGGNIDNDNSGILRYVSIRHGGTNIGQGNEINGLTLGGVGSETQIDHIEIISNQDDGIEFFGGTVNTRFVLVAFCGDDAFDFDLGYQGTNQFWCGIQSSASGDRIIEADGNSFDNPLAIPYTQPVLFNATFIGKRGNTGAQQISFDTDAAAKICNSIMINEDNGVLFEYSGFRYNSFDQLKDGRLQLEKNIFFNIRDNTPEEIFRVKGVNGENVDQQQIFVSGYFEEAGNLIADPGINILGDQITLFPTEQVVFENLAEYDDDWLLNVPYKGAFYSDDWTAGWTLLNSQGFINP